MLDIVFNFETKKGSYPKTFFAETIKTALAVLGFSKEKIGLSINLVEERRMRFLNKRYRGKDQATDVLSFPLFKGAMLKERFSLSSRAKKTRSGIIELGDIFICLPVIRQRAKLEHKNPEAFLRLLVVHGFLHLVGFDHEQFGEQQVMEKMEQRILRRVGL